jgi:hypothetical protein
MLPDVYFHTGSSHSDMLNAVEAAVKKVSHGLCRSEKIGINGHNYGGEGAAFIGTRSKLFAAVGMGAGVTDLYQDFSQNWGWGYQCQAAAARTATTTISTDRAGGASHRGKSPTSTCRSRR